MSSMSGTQKGTQDLVEEVRRFVTLEKNSVYDPAISTEEVAEEFGISEEEAYEALDESPYLDKKMVGNSHLWW